MGHLLFFRGRRWHREDLLDGGDLRDGFWVRSVVTNFSFFGFLPVTVACCLFPLAPAADICPFVGCFPIAGTACLGFAAATTGWGAANTERRRGGPIGFGGAMVAGARTGRGAESVAGWVSRVTSEPSMSLRWPTVVES
jgi:hypothetical protein